MTFSRTAVLSGRTAARPQVGAVRPPLRASRRCSSEIATNSRSVVLMQATRSVTVRAAAGNWFPGQEIPAQLKNSSLPGEQRL